MENLYTFGEIIDTLKLGETAIDTVWGTEIWFNPESKTLEYKDDTEEPVVIVFNTRKTKQGDKIYKILPGVEYR